MIPSQSQPQIFSSTLMQAFVYVILYLSCIEPWIYLILYIFSLAIVKKKRKKEENQAQIF